jgi:GxxExxY protein
LPAAAEDPDMEQGETEKQRGDEFTGQIMALASKCIAILAPASSNLLTSTAWRTRLALRDFRVQRQFPIPLNYKGLALDCGYRLDLVVDNRLIVEVKAVERLLPVHEAQVITYLKLIRLPLGLLVNFHVLVLRQGIRRLVNPTLNSSDPPFLPVDFSGSKRFG